MLVCVNIFFPTKPVVRIQSFPWSKYDGTKLRMFTVVFPARSSPMKLADVLWNYAGI